MADEPTDQLLKAIEDAKRDIQGSNTLLILKAISDARNEATKAIGDLNATVSEFHGDITARVNNIESDAKIAKRNHWILTYVVLPLTTAANAALAHWGVKI